MNLINEALQPQVIIGALLESAEAAWMDGRLYTARDQIEQAGLFVSLVREEHRASYESMVSEYITNIQVEIDRE